jgi:hypothetical protein
MELLFWLMVILVPNEVARLVSLRWAEEYQSPQLFEGGIPTGEIKILQPW